jgi:hypothetical protein
MDHRFEKGKNSCANCGLKAKWIVTFGYECVTEAPPPDPDWHLALTRDGITYHERVTPGEAAERLFLGTLWRDLRSVDGKPLDGAQTLLVERLLAAIDSFRGWQAL